jgi:fructose-1,6-bisphosphatase class II
MMKNYYFDFVEVTESAAIASYHSLGLGDNMFSDKLAVQAMRQKLGQLDVVTRVVIGEGERDKAPMLFVGEILGKGDVEFDIAVDPLEGTNIVAKGLDGAMSVMAVGPKNTILHAPDVYMEKIAIGFDFPEQLISLNLTIKENLRNIASAKKCAIDDLKIAVLSRDRHEDLIAQLRDLKCKVVLLDDGDVAAVINTTRSGGYDAYMGTGGAPEGVLACGALKVSGGQFCGRLVLDKNDLIERATTLGITEYDKIYYVDDLIKDDVAFIATAVTNCLDLQAVRYEENKIFTQTLLMSKMGDQKRIDIIKSCILR